jgi:hypothetical protein
MMELSKVEATSIAVSRGIGSEWAKDYVTALGLSSIRNPLGAALIHLDGHRISANFTLVVNMMAKELVRARMATEKDSVDLANDTIMWWLDPHCPKCKGAGVNFEQVPCKVCSGTGKKGKHPSIERPLWVIQAHLEWMESQQGKRLSGHQPKTLPTTKFYYGPAEEGPVTGWITPRMVNTDY